MNYNDGLLDLTVRKSPEDTVKRPVSHLLAESALLGLVFVDDRSNEALKSLKAFLFKIRPNVKELLIIVVPVSSNVDLKMLTCDENQSNALQICYFVDAGDPLVNSLISLYGVEEPSFVVSTPDGTPIDRNALSRIMKCPYKAIPDWIALAKTEKMHEVKTMYQQRTSIKKNREFSRNFGNATQDRSPDLHSNNKQKSVPVNKSSVNYELFLKQQERADGGIITDDESLFEENLASLNVASDSDVEFKAGFQPNVLTSGEGHVDSAEERKKVLVEPKIEVSTPKKVGISSIFTQSAFDKDRFRSVFDRYDDQNNVIAPTTVCGSAGTYSTCFSQKNSIREELLQTYDVTNGDHVESWARFTRWVSELFDFGEKEIDSVSEAVLAQWNQLRFQLLEEQYRELADVLISKAVDSENVVLVCCSLINAMNSKDDSSSKMQAEMLGRAFDASMLEKLTASYDVRIVHLINKFHNFGILPDHRLVIIMNAAFNHVTYHPAEALRNCLLLVEAAGCRLEKDAGPDSYVRSALSHHLANAKSILAGIPDTEDIRSYLVELGNFRHNGWKKLVTNFGGPNSDFVIETRFRIIEVQQQFLEIMSPKLKEYALTSKCFNVTTALAFKDILEVLYTMNISDRCFLDCRNAEFPNTFLHKTAAILSMAEDLELPKIQNFIELAIVASVCSKPCPKCIYKFVFALKYRLHNVKTNFPISASTWKEFAEHQLSHPSKLQITLSDLSEIIVRIL